MDALALFRTGLDTVEVAKALGIHESEASRRIAEQRARERGLPFDYVRHLPTVVHRVSPPLKAARPVSVKPKYLKLPDLSSPTDASFRAVNKVPIERRSRSKEFAPLATAFEPDEEIWDLGRPLHTTVDDCGDLLKEWGAK